MSRTLFWYIFKDLLRIFFLASGALAGIMSFGGLLRPLTEHGLEPAQFGKLLAFLMPGMLTYSLPIAAVFAATFVYGRLTADNELTACRAAGISHLAVATPALVLGLSLSIATLLFLSFVVPVFSLKVERLIYSNLAQLVARKIQNSHMLRVESWNVFAQDASVDESAGTGDRQVVVLHGPMITQYEKKSPKGPREPREFWMAQRATVYIQQNPKTDQVRIEVVVTNGTRFPAHFQGGVQGDVELSQVGPIEMPSPVRENTKFMDVAQLKDLQEHPRKSRKIAGLLEDLVRQEQQGWFLRPLAADLREPGGTVLVSDHDVTDRHLLSAAAGNVELRQGQLILTAGGQPVQLVHRTPGGDSISSEANQLVMEAQADNERGCMILTLRLDEALPRRLTVPMPEAIRAMRQHDVEYYLQHAPQAAAKLSRERLKLLNGIQAERHGRASFAVSCLILVLMGCALGMMFKSGNFLTAFAISVIPAMVTIVLIITGQQSCENLTAAQGLRSGLLLIWSGNAAVLALAAGLLWRVQRR